MTTSDESGDISVDPEAKRSFGHAVMSFISRRDVVKSAWAMNGLIWGTGIAGVLMPERQTESSLKTRINDIADMIERRLRYVPSDDTLIVPVGEHHDQPSHKIVIQGVAAELVKRGIRPAVGMEFDHGGISHDAVMQSWERQISSVEEWNDMRPTPERIQKAVADTDYLNARQGFRQLIAYMYSESIVFDFNDLDGVDKIDVNENMNKGYEEQAAKYRNVKSFSLAQQTRSPDGLFLRNVAMAQRIDSNANSYRRDLEDGGGPVRVYLQHTGNAHLLGNDESPFQESLYNILKERFGRQVLAISLSGDKPEQYPVQAQAVIRDGNAVLVDCMRQGFNYTTISENPAAMRALEIKETYYVRNLAREAGVNFYLHEPVPYVAPSVPQVPAP
ncbi:MAG: hypothetical protein DI551_03960 [Micavibrio aeruginosavorus]|uniref:Uncharacterized protein n=1 Tax=Micavibrio aeruginosavorus TaxID=349221 RepID=A0A2W5N8J1_9BACT|nr:MAG: hypothetical protein DI551_03960 [Micavibrio aeruginosavorus]